MGHFYTLDGEPRYRVVGANGRERDSTIADARKHNWLPSVTEILKIIDKPQLTEWLVNQGVLAALTLPRADSETEAEWLRRVKDDSRAQAREAAAEGSRIHDAIEDHFKGREVPRQYQPHVSGVLDKLAEIFPHVTDWVAEKSFGCPAGFGGRVDLHSPSSGIVVDFKGKDCAPGDTKKLAYDQHYQLGAYHVGLDLPPAPGCNLFVSRTHPGHVVEHIWSPEDMDEGRAVFLAALRLWQAIKKHQPA